MGQTEKFDWVTDDIRTFMSRGYIQDCTVEERYRQIADRVGEIAKTMSNPNYNTDELSDKIYDYCRRNLISFSSPILSNFGTDKGLPISCNFGKVDDTLHSIVHGMYEMSMLAKHGAGTAKNLTAIRPYGVTYGKDSLGKSEGLISWAKSYSDLIEKVNQGGMRRGFLTVYCSIEHPEIDSFLDIGANGEETESPGFAIQNITTGVTIPAGWIESMKAGDVEKRKIYAKILKRRSEIAFPYILFEDNCNKQRPQVYVDKDMYIDSSNICTEVIEYCDSEKEFTCCLLSLNLVHYDEWPDDLVFIANLILDTVLTEYIEKASKIPGFEKAVKFASEHRAIGVGVLGFHNYLQKKMIPFGSLESYAVNNSIFKHIREESDKASRWMAATWGEPVMLKGYKHRNTTRVAIAPTKSSSFIMGNWSLSIEPVKSNCHEKTLAKIQMTYKNPMLVPVLERYGKNTREIWKSILEHNGSVQHLDFLTDLERAVFKTFSEISQVDIIKLAAQRQKYIDQGQSINLMIHPNTPPKSVSDLILLAHEEGIKTLYYQYSINAAQMFNEDLMTCSACEA
jgi:ribonucleoside-diphosphate reductase alpha chain